MIVLGLRAMFDFDGTVVRRIPHPSHTVPQAALFVETRPSSDETRRIVSPLRRCKSPHGNTLQRGVTAS
jgi:hypothetical protein